MFKCLSFVLMTKFNSEVKHIGHVIIPEGVLSDY